MVELHAEKKKVKEDLVLVSTLLITQLLVLEMMLKF